MRDIIKIISVVYTFIYLLIFDYFYVFVSFYGLTVIIIYTIIFCGITKTITKSLLYCLPIILFASNLVLLLFYVSNLWLLLFNVTIGILYLWQYFKIREK